MKKVIYFMLAVLCVSFAGCSDSPKGPVPYSNMEDAGELAKERFKTASETMGELIEEGNENQEKSLEARKKEYENKKVEVNDTIETETSTMKLKSYAILNNTIYGMEDEKVIVLTFDYTNNREYDSHFDCNINGVYQNGIALNRHSDELDAEVYQSIRQGATLEVVVSYQLRNDTDSIEFIFDKNPGTAPLDGEDPELEYILDI